MGELSAHNTDCSEVKTLWYVNVNNSILNLISGIAVDISGSLLVLINIVNLHWAWLVLGWVIVHGSESYLHHLGI